MLGVHEAVPELLAGEGVVNLTNVVGGKGSKAEELQQLVAKVSHLGPGILKGGVALEGEEEEALRIIILPKEWHIGAMGLLALLHQSHACQGGGEGEVPPILIVSLRSQADDTLHNELLPSVSLLFTVIEKLANARHNAPNIPVVDLQGWSHPGGSLNLVAIASRTGTAELLHGELASLLVWSAEEAFDCDGIGHAVATTKFRGIQ